MEQIRLENINDVLKYYIHTDNFELRFNIWLYLVSEINKALSRNILINKDLNLNDIISLTQYLANLYNNADKEISDFLKQNDLKLIKIELNNQESFDYIKRELEDFFLQPMINDWAYFNSTEKIFEFEYTSETLERLLSIIPSIIEKYYFTKKLYSYLSSFKPRVETIEVVFDKYKKYALLSGENAPNSIELNKSQVKSNVLDKLQSSKKSIAKFEQKEVLSTFEVQELLSISRQCIDNYVKSGFLIPHKQGNKNYYYFSEIKKALDAGTILKKKAAKFV